MSGVTDIVLDEAIAALRPSEYTGALIQVLRATPHRILGAKVLEIGSGSGVVLAALGALGAASLWRRHRARSCGGWKQASGRTGP